MLAILGISLRRFKARLLGPPATSGYRQISTLNFQRPRDLPPFTFNTIRVMLMDPTVRLGLAMRAAPLQQAEFAFKVPDNSPQGFRWQPGIRADRPDVAAFVERQLNRIWRFYLHKILLAQTWGWSAGECTYKLGTEGLVEFDAILHRHSQDCFALTKNGAIKGVQFRRVQGVGNVNLLFPKCFWHVYDPIAESPYSFGALLGAYSPWADKWLNGGALDVRRLFAVKDAYGGMNIGYPAGSTEIDGKGAVPNRDIAREMVEQAKAGQVITRPSDMDPTTNSERWPIQYANIPTTPTHIFDYPKQLDVEILRGLLIPDDVITSEGTGAWQGKQVPMQAFFTVSDVWLAQVVQVVTAQILEPLVLLNWGRPEAFEVVTKPLATQAMEQMAALNAPATATVAEDDASTLPDQTAGDSQNLSLDAAVGRGVIEAAEVVKTGRTVMEALAKSKSNGHQNGDS